MEPCVLQVIPGLVGVIGLGEPPNCAGHWASRTGNVLPVLGTYSHSAASHDNSHIPLIKLSVLIFLADGLCSSSTSISANSTNTLM